MDLIICTECGLEIPEKVFRDGRSHLKRRYCFEAGERIRARLAATERELDEFRRLLLVAIEKRDRHAERISGLEGSAMKIEKRAQAARDIIAKRLRNCPGNFHEENPGGCTGSCESFGCKTLRGIRDTLKE